MIEVEYFEQAILFSSYFKTSKTVNAKLRLHKLPVMQRQTKRWFGSFEKLVWFVPVAPFFLALDFLPIGKTFRFLVSRIFTFCATFLLFFLCVVVVSQRKRQ